MATKITRAVTRLEAAQAAVEAAQARVRAQERALKKALGEAVYAAVNAPTSEWAQYQSTPLSDFYEIVTTKDAKSDRSDSESDTAGADELNAEGDTHDNSYGEGVSPIG